jgi:hypothetical protein
VTELGAALLDPTHGTEALTILRPVDKVTLMPSSDDRFAIELEGRGCWRWHREAMGRAVPPFPRCSGIGRWLRGHAATFTEHLLLCRLRLGSHASILKHARSPEHRRFESRSLRQFGFRGNSLRQF